MALKIQETADERVREVMDVARVVERRGGKVGDVLADQMRRSALSTAGQLAEGSAARGRNAAAKLQGAIAEGRERPFYLRYAVAARWATEQETMAALQIADRICACLWTLVHRRQGGRGAGVGRRPVSVASRADGPAL